MIVVCPSCGTSFSHAAEERSARSARCSRCSFTFPMPAARSYRIETGGVEALPAAAGARGAVEVGARPSPSPGRGDAPVPRAAGDLAIGMDDPTLTASLGRTALTRGTGPGSRAMTYWVMSADERRDAAVPEASSPDPAASEAAPPSGSETAAIDAPPPELLSPGWTRGRRVALALAGGAGGGVAWGAALGALVGRAMWPGAAVGCACGVALAGGVLLWRARRP